MVINYFELFGLEAQFEVPNHELTTRYRALLHAVHPDRFSHGSQSEQAQAVMKSAQINDAFACLKDPIRRAEHLLALSGIELEDEATTVKDTQFLMAQMQWREDLDTLRQAAQPESELARMQAQIHQDKRAQIDALAQALQQERWHDATTWIFKLKFLFKLEQELEKIEDSLLD
tara:strand:+ start:6413 stop:6934 length:522 start_codon:yes stop_codon:yes gene_type:complete